MKKEAQVTNFIIAERGPHYFAAGTHVDLGVSGSDVPDIV
jgi:hypothetical protein